MKFNKKTILEGVLLLGLAGVISCNSNKNVITKDVEYLNNQDTLAKIMNKDGTSVQYDSSGRIIQYNGNPVKYDKQGRVSGIGSHKVFYDEKTGRIIHNPSYLIKNKKK